MHSAPGKNSRPNTREARHAPVVQSIDVCRVRGQNDLVALQCLSVVAQLGQAVCPVDVQRLYVTGATDGQRALIVCGCTAPVLELAVGIPAQSPLQVQLARYASYSQRRIDKLGVVQSRKSCNEQGHAGKEAAHPRLASVAESLGASCNARVKHAIAASSSLQARWHSPRFLRKAALVGSSAIAASKSAAASAGLPRRSSSRPLGRVGGSCDSRYKVAETRTVADEAGRRTAHCAIGRRCPAGWRA